MSNKSRANKTGRRNDMGRFAKAPSKKSLIASWFGAVIGAALMYFAALGVWANFSSFRSCSANDGRVLTDCGKHGVNTGDVIILGLFILASFMALSLGTHALRMTKRMLP